MTPAEWLALPVEALPPCRVRWVPGCGVVVVLSMPRLTRKVPVRRVERDIVECEAWALVSDGADAAE